MPDREEAQRRRAEARAQRRGGKGGAAPDGAAARDGADVGTAVKAAAGAAALGATVAAARRLADRDEPKHDVLDDLDVRSAVKAAAGAAALGATVAAARALAERSPDEEADRDAETTDEHEEAPEPQLRDEHGDEVEERDGERPEPQLRDEDEEDDEEEEPAEDERREPEPAARGAELDDVRRAVAAAREQLSALQSRPIESVSGVARTRDGWVVTLEVVELARIPESTDILATYDVVLDDDANLQRYSRGRRYHRSQADGEGP